MTEQRRRELSEDEVLAQIDSLRAHHIAKMAELEGWQILKQEIEDRINSLTAHIVSGEDSGSIEATETRQIGGKTYVTIIQVNRDEFKHEIKVWRRFLRKIETAINYGKER